VKVYRGHRSKVPHIPNLGIDWSGSCSSHFTSGKSSLYSMNKKPGGSRVSLEVMAKRKIPDLTARNGTPAIHPHSQ